MTRLVEIVNGRPYIDPGRMRHKITILSQGPTSPPTYDHSGAALSARVPFTTGMAAIEGISGVEQIKGGQVTTQSRITIAMFFQPGILSNMFAQRENGSVLLIQSIDNILEMDLILVLNCLGLGAND